MAKYSPQFRSALRRLCRSSSQATLLRPDPRNFLGKLGIVGARGRESIAKARAAKGRPAASGSVHFTPGGDRSGLGISYVELVELMAKLSAEMAGVRAETRLVRTLGAKIIYDGPAWQDPGFLEKAESALGVLAPDYERDDRTAA